jgi:hypothetical protein
MAREYLEAIDSTSLALDMTSKNEKLTVEVQLDEICAQEDHVRYFHRLCHQQFWIMQKDHQRKSQRSLH